MADIHITREMLEAVARGELPARVLTDTGWKHLLALCPACRTEFEMWQRSRSDSPSYGTTLKVLPTVIERHSSELEQKRPAAERDLKTLLRLPHKERLARIRRATARFRGILLAGLLLEESRKHMPTDFREVHDLAETAAAVLHRTIAGSEVGPLSARAAATMGNALRVLGDPQRAKECFRAARSFIRVEAVTDPHVCAEVDWFEGALLMDERRFQKSEEFLTRAVTLFALTNDRRQAARPMLTLGTLYYHQGDLARATQATEQALDLLPPEDDLRFYLYARHNLTWYLCEAGQYSAAAEAFRRDQPLYKEFPDHHTQLRVIWLEGKIVLGLGKEEEAIQAFQAVREGFILQQSGYDAAMVSLDLAVIYLSQGRTFELKSLAEEIHQVFASQDVHREATAALLFFEEAVRQEKLTSKMVSDLTAYLKAARSNPALPFKKPV